MHNTEDNKASDARQSYDAITSNEDDYHQQVTLLVLGAGNRGNIYSHYAKDFPNLLKIVGVAEPRISRRLSFQKKYDIEDGLTFTDWKEAAALKRFADAVLIATLDDLHHDPCVAFADLGYHILCEKPMAPTEKECVGIMDACERNNVILAVGHVLRYTQEYMKVKRLLMDGEIGDVMGIQHMEQVGWWHFAHSFVRGNWSKAVKDSGSLMAKCCHDFDLIKYFLGDVKCVKIQSFGSLSHFNKSNQPINASSRCLDCKVEPECPYSAVRHYIEPLKRGSPNWTCFVIADNPDIETVTDALRTGPYGKCVYDSDNDVCDYQVVNMEFENSRYVTFTMSAFTRKVGQRKIRIFGSRGQIECDGSEIEVFNFVTENARKIKQSIPKDLPSIAAMSVHVIADYYLMKSFVKAVATGDRSVIHSGPRDSLRGHKMVFAAKRSRKLGGVTLDVDI